MNINKLPYLNYPNPRLRRKNYQILNGIWDFAFIEKMEIPESFDKKIKVPLLMRLNIVLSINKSFMNI